MSRCLVVDVRGELVAKGALAMDRLVASLEKLASRWRWGDDDIVEAWPLQTLLAVDDHRAATASSGLRPSNA
jgi:hypothetical protein